MAISPAYECHGGAHMFDYTPTADVVAGQMIKIGPFICVAHRDIKAGELGALSFPGGNNTYRVALKAAGTFDVGDIVKVDIATGEASAAGAEIFGYCVEKDVDQATGDTHVIAVHAQFPAAP